MDKIMIELWIPAAELKLDVMIPRASKLYVVQKLLAAAVADLSTGKYMPTSDAALFDRTGKFLDINMSVEELGLINGSQLMLI